MRQVSFLFAIVSILQFNPASTLRIREDQLGKPKDSTFDYVGKDFHFLLTLCSDNSVVGGGTAGLTVAARLAEFASVAVCSMQIPIPCPQ